MTTASTYSTPLSLIHAGSSFSPLGLADRLPAGLWIPPVTVVFCKVDGGGHSMISRREADEVHSEIVALMCSVMRQVRDSAAGQWGRPQSLACISARDTQPLSLCADSRQLLGAAAGR